MEAWVLLGVWSGGTPETVEQSLNVTEVTANLEWTCGPHEYKAKVKFDE
jgi:hypothetical protein